VGGLPPKLIGVEALPGGPGAWGVATATAAGGDDAGGDGGGEDGSVPAGGCERIRALSVEAGRRVRYTDVLDDAALSPPPRAKSRAPGAGPVSIEKARVACATRGR
jgi:hypothetical protein